MTKEQRQRISYAFAMWLKKGGYVINAGNPHFVSAKRRDKVVKVYWKDGRLNQHGEERFKLFLNQYLNQGKSFIPQLIWEANAEKSMRMFKLKMANFP